MSHERQGIKILGLSLLIALCAMATIATGAQAEGDWKIGGEFFQELEIKEASVTGSAGETFTLTIPWYEAEIECTVVSLETAKILANGGSEGILRFKACTILGSPFIKETCKVIEPIQFKIKDLLIVHKSKIYDLLSPSEAGKPFTTIEFKEGTECPLPLKNEVTGSFVGETEAGQRVKQPLTFNSTVDKLFPSDTLSFGGHPATLKGKAVMELASPYAGKEWSASEKFKEGTPEVPEFTINGKSFASKGITSEEASGTVEALKFLLTEIKITFACTGGDITSATVLLGGTAHGSVLLLGCSLEGNKFCTVYPTKTDMENKTNKGQIAAAGLGLLLLMSKQHFLLLEATGGSFTTFYLSPSSEGCGLGGAWSISGSTVMELPEALTSGGVVNQKAVTLSPATLASLFPSDVLKVGGFSTSVDGGSSTAHLSGGHNEKKWGAE